MFLPPRRTTFRLFALPTLRSACEFTVAVLLVLGAGAKVWAQGTDHLGTGGRHVIRGRILFPSGQRVDTGFKVRLESASSGDRFVMTDANGTFRFQSLIPGAYSVIVEGGDNFETVRERVTIDSDGLDSRNGTTLPSSTRSHTLQIYLQPKKYLAATAKPGVINAALASVPKPARELYEKAIESVRKGENHKAAEQLHGAIALYPDFGLAFTELGVLYMKMKQPDKAAEALRTSLKFSPDDATALLTYGIALFDKNEFAEAETTLRQAVKKHHYSPFAHCYLGMSLIRQRRNLDEAEKELVQAIKLGGDQISMVHYYLGGLYWNKRDYGRAADELEKYLQLSPKARDAEKVRATIKELRHKQ